MSYLKMIILVIAAFIYLSVTVNVRTAIAEIKEIFLDEKDLA
jgi:hypothetical protein